MITHIKAKGLKGQEINEPLAQHQIYVGPNGSGKSSRAQAIALTILGYIPWGASAKKPGDILAAYGSGGGAIKTSITCNGIDLERKIAPTATGASQKFKANGANRGKNEFPTELFKAGAPTIFNLGEFIGSSDAKKISTLFSLFPPAGDVSAIETAIEKTKDSTSLLKDQISNLEGTIVRLSSSRKDLNLPAGTLAEVKNEITEATAQWHRVNDEIKAEEIRLAKLKAAEEAKAQAAVDQKAKEKREAEEAARLVRDKAEAAKKASAKTSQPTAEPTAEATASPGGHSGPLRGPAGPSSMKAYQLPADQPATSNATNTTAPSDTTHATTECRPVDSLNKVWKAMDSAGCKVCVAKLVLKKEISKWSRK